MHGELETRLFFEAGVKSAQEVDVCACEGHVESLSGRSRGLSVVVSIKWELSPRLSGLWRWRFGHSCCVVGASSHIERLDFSSDHHEDVWKL